MICVLCSIVNKILRFEMCKLLDFTHHLIFWGKWSCKKCIVLQLKLAFSAAAIYVKGLTEEEPENGELDPLLR